MKEIQKVKVEKIRKKYEHTLSSHAFPSIYLWQDVMGLSLHCEDDFFCSKCGTKGENAWFFPCGNEKNIYEFICEHMKEESFSLCYLREEDKNWLEKNFPDKWEFHREESCDEYIGDIAEYLSLEGSKFSEIRSKIRKIDREYEITSSIITDENIQDAMAVILQWKHVKHNASEDELVAEIALKEREFLGINGVIVYANASPVCVFAGFPISEDMLDIVIGKSVPNAPKGIAYYGLREYLKLCGTGYTYCNHEEDLGIMGIRQMKNSLCPIFKVPIWEAVLK